MHKGTGHGKTLFVTERKIRACSLGKIAEIELF
jgi:hypothetical protein